MEKIIFPFTGVQLTEAINIIPNQYGMLNALNLMPSEGITSTLVQIYRENGLIHVLPQVERGGPATVAERKRSDALYFEAPHFPHMDVIKPADMQNMLKIVAGGRAQNKTLADEMVKRLQAIRNKHAITREFLRMGALKGLIRDGNGETIYDLFQAFGITKKVVNFELDNPDTNVRAKCAEVVAHVQDNLLGEVMTQVEMIVSTAFFDKLVSHPNVEKFWLNSDNGKELAHIQRQELGRSWGSVWEFGEILFREYRGLVPLKTGAEPFVEANKGHAYPVGTMDTFRTYDAPADKLSAVNLLGEEINITTHTREHEKGEELHTESNPLPIVKRPEILVEAVAA